METRFSGIDFIPNKNITLNDEQQKELAFISRHDKNGNVNGFDITSSTTCKVSKILSELDQSNKEVVILKGSVDAILILVQNASVAEGVLTFSLLRAEK